MRTLPKSLLVTTLSLAASVFMLAGVSHAGSITEIRARLMPCSGTPCDPATPAEPGAEGQARRKTLPNSDEFKITVEVPLTNAIKVDENSDIRAILSRGTNNSIECIVEFDEIDLVEKVFQFKTDLRSRKGVFQQRMGSCTDLDGPGVGIDILANGIPDAMAGDMVTVRVVNAPDVNFLKGTFVLKKMK